MPVPILKQQGLLIASAQSALSDADWLRLETELLRQVGQHRAHGVVIDVSALDVVDSFATRTLRGIALMSRLRGAEAVIVGIQPEAAMAMAQLGLGQRFADIRTALDLEEGMAILRHRRKGSSGAT